MTTLTSTTLTLQPPRVDFLDTRTGKVSREWYRYFDDLTRRVGGATAYTADQMLVGQYNSSGILTEIDSVYGNLWVDELTDSDINYWLTRAEIEDARSGQPPTINLTLKIQTAIDALWSKSQTPYRGTANMYKTGQTAVLRLHGSYLVDSLTIYPGMMLEGDNLTETILVQSASAVTDFITVAAVNGHTAKQRASWGCLRDLTLQGNGVSYGPDVGAGPVPLHGLTCASASSDPYYSGGDNYNSYIADNVRAYNFTGDGFHCPTSRKRPRHLECRASSNLGNGFYCADSADSFWFECASGSNDQHSIYILKSDTPRIMGGDFWASNNAATAYRAFYIDRVHEGIVFGCDINGAFEFAGTNNAGDTEYYQTDYKFTIDSCNFKFRAGSFGDGGDGTDGVPDPLDGYIIVSNARGVNTRNCSYQPAWDRTTGLATYRPSNIYYLTGDTAFQADDKLPDINSGLWPCGAVVAFPGVYDNICNAWLKLNGQWLIPDLTNSQNATMMTYWKQVPTKAGGQVGRNDGTSPTAGTVGEVVNAKVTSGAPIALTSTVGADVCYIDLTPGEWDIYGSVVFQGNGATGTALKTAISTASGTTPSVNANSYSSSLIPFAGLTGDIASAQVGPVRAPLDSSSATYRYYLTVKATFTVGTMAVFGQIQARRIS